MSESGIDRSGRSNTVDVAALVRFKERLQAWRALPWEVQLARIGAGEDEFEPSTEPSAGRIRVGLWCPCLGLGGAEVWQLALARAVDRSRIVWQGAAVLDGRASTHPRMERSLRALMPVGHGSSAAKILAATSDVIVTWAVTNVGLILEGLEPRPSVVMACHFPAESPWGPGTADLLGPVDRIVAVSELAVDSTPPEVRERIEVIWNAVDPARLAIARDRGTVRASWGVPADARVVGFLGRLSPEKDPDAMLRLAAELADPWHLVIVGEGRERDQLERRIEESRLDRVHLVGGDEAAGDVLNAFDVLVVPSEYESFGLTLAEGFWAGIPTIATRSGLARLVPGLVREIPVGATGRQLSEALHADLDDPKRTQSRVNHAREFARHRLGLARFGRDWTDLLVDVAQPGQGRHS